MADYGLPKPPDNHRWFLAKHSLEYAKLHLQRRRILGGWKSVHDELVNLHSDYQPFEVCVKEKAAKSLRVIQDPKVKYGVVT